MGYRNPGHPTPCPHCVSPPTLLPSEKAMVAHVHAHHPTLAPFPCLAGCGRYFKSKPGALKHSGTCKPPAPQHQHRTAGPTDNAAHAPPPDSRAAARRECPACGAWLASAASLARHRRTTACAGRKRVWVGGGADPRGAATAPPTTTAPPQDGAANPMRHGNRWRRSWVVVDEGRDEAEVRGEEPAAVAGRKRRFAEERRPGEGEGEREGKRVKRVKRTVERAPRGRNVERKQEVVQMMGVWSLQKREGGQEQEKEYKQEEFQERVWNLQMQEVKPEEIQELVEDKNEDDEEDVVIRFPVAGKRLPSTVSPPRKTVSGKTVPGKAMSGNTVPSKTVAGKTVAGKTVPRKTMPRKTVPRKTVPQSKNEESEADEAGMEDSETKESEVEVVEWEDESDDDGEESEWDDEDYM